MLEKGCGISSEISHRKYSGSEDADVRSKQEHGSEFVKEARYSKGFSFESRDA
jgi:hypothetical protein